MKITLDLLKKIKACNEAINKFYNTKELHDIDITNITTIEVTDNTLFDDISWLQNKLKNHFKLKTLTYKNSKGYFEEYTYDDRGNKLTYKDSKGNSYEYTYDEKNNLLTTKSSNGYSCEYTYDERGNMLSHKYSTGYTEEYTYDEVYDLKGFKYL